MYPTLAKKATLLLFLPLLALVSCDNKSNTTNSTTSTSVVTNANGTPKMKFQDSIHDFGVIDLDTKVAYPFTFTNTGNAPLLIADVKASCGCTTPDWPRSPIAPGETGKIDVVYNSTGHNGEKVNKTITIRSNAIPGTSILTIVGQVKETAK